MIYNCANHVIIYYCQDVVIAHCVLRNKLYEEREILSSYRKDGRRKAYFVTNRHCGGKLHVKPRTMRRQRNQDAPLSILV